VLVDGTRIGAPGVLCADLMRLVAGGALDWIVDCWMRASVDASVFCEPREHMVRRFARTRSHLRAARGQMEKFVRAVGRISARINSSAQKCKILVRRS
jgi:hypothetical protein